MPYQPFDEIGPWLCEIRLRRLGGALEEAADGVRWPAPIREEGRIEDDDGQEEGGDGDGKRREIPFQIIAREMDVFPIKDGEDDNTAGHGENGDEPCLLRGGGQSDEKRGERQPWGTWLVWPPTGQTGHCRCGEQDKQRFLYIIGTIENERSGNGRQRGGENGGQMANNGALAADEQNQQGGGGQRDGADGRLRAMRDVPRAKKVRGGNRRVIERRAMVALRIILIATPFQKIRETDGLVGFVMVHGTHGNDACVDDDEGHGDGQRDELQGVLHEEDRLCQYFDDDLAAGAFADAWGVGVLRIEEGEAAWTDGEPRHRLVREEAAIFLCVEFRGFSAAFDGRPTHGLVAGNDILDVDVFTVGFKLRGLLRAERRLLNHGVDFIAIDVVASAWERGERL